MLRPTMSASVTPQAEEAAEMESVISAARATPKGAKKDTSAAMPRVYSPPAVEAAWYVTLISKNNKKYTFQDATQKNLEKFQQSLVESLQKVDQSQVRVVGGPRVLQAAGRRRGGPALRHRHPAAQRDWVAPHRPRADDGHPGAPRCHVLRAELCHMKARHQSCRMKARHILATTARTHRAAVQFCILRTGSIRLTTSSRI